MTILDSLNVVILVPDPFFVVVVVVLFYFAADQIIYISCHCSNTFFILLYNWFILCYVYRLTPTVYHVVVFFFCSLLSERNFV